MKETIKYFDINKNECTPDQAVRVIVQQTDEAGQLIDEKIYFK